MVVADAGLGADLPRGLDEVEGGHIGAPQRVAEGVAGVGVGGRHRGADVLARGGVLRDFAGHARGTEHRRVVGRRVGPPGPGRVGPAGVALGVGGAHPRLIERVRDEAGNGRGRARDVHRAVAPGPGAAHAVLHVVAGDGGLAGVGRGGPGDRQAGGAAGHCRDHGRRRRAGRLVHVGDADGDIGVGSGGAVGGRDRDRVGRLGLVVVADAGLGADLPRGLDEVEGGHIGAPQRVAEGVAGVGVGGRHRGADVTPAAVFSVISRSDTPG